MSQIAATTKTDSAKNTHSQEKFYTDCRQTDLSFLFLLSSINWAIDKNRMKRLEHPGGFSEKNCSIYDAD